MWNPKIASIEFDGMDTESSVFSAANMSIKHEGVEYVATSQPLTDALIAQFGLDRGSYYEPQDLFGGANAFLMDISDGLQNAVDGLLNNVSQNVPFVGQALAAYGSKVIGASGVTGFPVSVAQKLSASSLGKWGSF